MRTDVERFVACCTTCKKISLAWIHMVYTCVFLFLLFL
jgi:hypothetical protein